MIEVLDGHEGNWGELRDDVRKGFLTVSWVIETIGITKMLVMTLAKDYDRSAELVRGGRDERN